MVDSLGQEDSAKAGAMQALEPARPGQVLLSHLISVWPWVSHWLGAVLTTCRQEPLPCGVITRIDGIAHQNHQARCQASWKKGCMKGMISGLIHLSGATWNPPVSEGRHILMCISQASPIPAEKRILASFLLASLLAL